MNDKLFGDGIRMEEGTEAEKFYCGRADLFDLLKGGRKCGRDGCWMVNIKATAHTE